MTPQCEICFLDYNLSDRMPMVLSCGHTFCKNCLDDMKICALCRSPVVQEILKFVPKQNHVLLQMLLDKEEDTYAEIGEKVYDVTEVKSAPTSGIAVLKTGEWFVNNSNLLFGAKPPLEKLLFAKYHRDENGLYRFHFQTEKPEQEKLSFITWNSLVNSLALHKIGSIPQELFFKVYREDTIVGEIFIRLNLKEGDLLDPAAANFLLMASGIKSPRSYKGAKFSASRKYVYSRFGKVLEVCCSEESGSFLPFVKSTSNCNLHESFYSIHSASIDGEFSTKFRIKINTFKEKSGFAELVRSSKVVRNIENGDYIKDCGFIF